MEDHKDNFFDLLVRYRGRTGFTQQDLAHKIGVHRRTIDNWETRASRPGSRGQVLRLADELFLSKEERKAFVQVAGFSLERWPTEIWTVPQKQDMFFTGRDDVFRSLRELLIPGSMTALTQAISGLGGIGKTHMAVEYAYRFHSYYDAVLWLQADSWETLVSACISLIVELELPEQKESDQIIAEVKHWLRKHRFWLLILDNVENPQEILSNFVPTQHQGSILMTTRVHNVEPLAQTQVLSTMSEEEGILFLLRRTLKVALNNGLDQASVAQHDEARQIWQLMEGLPARARPGRCLYSRDKLFILRLSRAVCSSAYRTPADRRGKRLTGHEESVATTFSLAFERVEALTAVSADILRACSLLSSDAIPEEIFHEGAQYLGPLLAAGGAYWDLAISVLQDYSLVQRNADVKTLTIHRLVQAVLKDTMDTSTYQVWAKRVVQAIETVLPAVDYHTTGGFERFSHSCPELCRTY